MEQVGIKLDALFLNKIEYQEKCLGVWNKFLESLKPEIMDLSLVDLKGIVDDYFEFNPPFENSEKKRKEFPDAFIANQIRERFGKDEIIAIISNDKGFKKACGCSENHVFFASLGELYNTMNRQERRQQGDFFNHRTKKSGHIPKRKAGQPSYLSQHLFQCR